MVPSYGPELVGLLRSRWNGAPAPPVYDVDGLLAQARRHRVLGLVAGARGVPAEVVMAARPLRLEALARWAQLRRVIEALEEAGVEVVVLKGPPLAHEAHGHFAAREARDLDLLVALEQVARASAALVAAGLRPGAIAGKETAKDTPFTGDGGEVELHWQLFGNAHLMPVDPAWLAAPRRLEVEGIPVPVLPRDVGLHYLLAHGATHRWARLKWVADVAALLAARPELADPELARRLGVERAAAEGLIVCERVFGGVPAVALDWARCQRGAERLARSSLCSLTGPEAARAGLGARFVLANGTQRLALKAGGRYRLAELRTIAAELAGLR